MKKGLWEILKIDANREKHHDISVNIQKPQYEEVEGDWQVFYRSAGRDKTRFACDYE